MRHEAFRTPFMGAPTPNQSLCLRGFLVEFKNSTESWSRHRSGTPDGVRALLFGPPPLASTVFGEIEYSTNVCQAAYFIGRLSLQDGHLDGRQVPVKRQLKMSSHNGVVPAPGKVAIHRSPLRRCVSWTWDKIHRLGIRYFVFLIFMGALFEVLGRQSGLDPLHFHLRIEMPLLLALYWGVQFRASSGKVAIIRRRDAIRDSLCRLRCLLR